MRVKLLILFLFLKKWPLFSSPSPVSILHIYTAKGLREYAYAAAERLRDLDKLDAKEHKGKVTRSACVISVNSKVQNVQESCEKHHKSSSDNNCHNENK